MLVVNPFPTELEKEIKCLFFSEIDRKNWNNLINESKKGNLLKQNEAILNDFN